LSDSSEQAVSDVYRATHAVRILEFESSHLQVDQRAVRADVELWDVSGDADRFRACWPAVRSDAHGVIFVFDPHKEEQAKELEPFYEYFVGATGSGSLGEAQCVVMASCRANGGRIAKGAKLPFQFNRIPQLQINIEEEGQRVRSDFNTFLVSLLTNLSATSQEEEMRIMGH